MASQIFKNLLFIACLWHLAGSAVAEQNYAVGFRLIEEQASSGFSGGVWYPSVDEEFEQKLGPFRPKWAWEGKPTEGKRPAILFSHGVMGRFRNHRDTAAALARKGYIVIIPQHTKDQWIGARTVDAVEHRIAEFARTLQHFAQAEPEIAKLIDEQNIGAIGYSLGGLTALGASGTIPDTRYVVQHCLENEHNDPNFCLADLSWWHNIRRWWAGTDLVHWYYDTGLKDKDFVTQIEPPINFRAIALVAPVAAAYYPEQIGNIDAEVAIFRLEKDKINRFPFHADYLHRTLGDKQHFYKVYKDAHHFAFISPYPEWLLKKEYIPVAMDPAGFNRRLFLKEINSDIVNFFTSVMPVVENSH